MTADDASDARKRLMTSISSDPAYLIFDVETVPDGVLLQRVKYPADAISPTEAVERARTEARIASGGKSDFVPLNFCYPVAVCVARVAVDFTLQLITCLDAPDFRPEEIAQDFWRGLSRYRSTLVSYNGRAFDLPVLELSAFRWGIAAPDHFSDKFGRRHRFGVGHLDLADWLSNRGAATTAGGLNLLSKLLGKPGKMHVTGADVWQLFQQGKIQEINDYCMYDVLDTYFVFLRTRILTGELKVDEEQDRMKRAREWIESQIVRYPHLQLYLDNWGNWDPWI
jgi:predicted PolB exonuclease-like 3'-5' exonuclease